MSKQQSGTLFLDAEISYGTITNQPKIAKIYGEMTQIGARDQDKSPQIQQGQILSSRCETKTLFFILSQPQITFRNSAGKNDNQIRETAETSKDEEGEKVKSQRPSNEPKNTPQPSEKSQRKLTSHSGGLYQHPDLSADFQRLLHQIYEHPSSSC